MRTPAILLALLAALALPLAACGDDASTSTLDEVTADWRAAAEAAASGDAAGLCARVTDDAKATIKKETGLECADAVKILVSRAPKADLDALKTVKITTVTVAPDGKTANVEYTITSGLRALGFDGSSDMVKSADGWLLKGG